MQHDPNCAVVRLGDIRSWCDCGRGSEMTEITQADWDATEKLWNEVEVCACDKCHVFTAEAFARHRSETEQKIVAWLRGKADEYDSGHRESWPTIDSFNQTADAIEQGSHLK